MDEKKAKELTDSIFDKLNDQERLYLAWVHNQKNKEIESLNNIINKIEEHFVFLKMNSTGGNKEFFEDILVFIKALKELKGSEK